MGLSVHARDDANDGAAVHLRIVIFTQSRCGGTIELLAWDIGTATTCEDLSSCEPSTPLDEDSFHIAPTLSTAFLVAKAYLCNMEHNIQFNVPPHQRGCNADDRFTLTVNVTWEATGAPMVNEQGHCRAASAEATITLESFSYDVPDYAFQPTGSASLCDPWTFCAPEGGLCAFTATSKVRYGADGTYVYQTFTDGTACTNAVFGDPLFGTRKFCAISIPPAATEWTTCAAERGQCVFSGTMEVRYGADGAYVYQTLANGTACTNAVFGDPIVGTVKACATRIPPDPTEWTFCAAEGGECAFTGAREVRYGANGVWVYQTLLDGTRCTNDVFGDPLYGVVKSCSLRTVSGSSLLTSR
jgi:hypothetical protein